MSAVLGGLTPDTAYRYRVVATSHCAPGDPEKACVTQGVAKSFRTYPLAPSGPPDGRAYELVSPPDKHGGQVFPADPRVSSCGDETECKPGELPAARFPMQSAPNGDAIAYEGSAFDPEVGAAVENAYIARRDPKLGWLTANPTPALLQGRKGGVYAAFSEDLRQAAIEHRRPALSPAAPSEYANLYAQPTDDPLALEPLMASEPPGRPPFGPEEFQIHFAGASTNLSRIFFEANDALTEETAFAPTAADGGPAKFNLYEWQRSTGQLRLVNVAPGNAVTEVGASFGTASANAISRDGSRAFWSGGAGQVYVREGAEVTREVPNPGKFLAAATDGSKVLLANGRLYDLEGETTTDLTEGKGGFEGIAGQSDDLSRVYFVDTEVLDGTPNQEGEVAGAGKKNLYAWDEGAIRFVARLQAKDNEGTSSVGLYSDWSPVPVARTAQASPGGRYLAFLSVAPLTGYENTGPCESSHGSGYVDAPCPEVFLYDSVTGKLSCPSCNPSGARSLGFSYLRTTRPGTLLQTRYLTEEGRLYFDTQESLSPLDTNEGVEDVYEYEPKGVGSCERPGGCVLLVSAGTGLADSNLVAIDPSGKNVFFTTRDQLALKDKDELFDLYDARVEGGIAIETETQRSECQGEACQPAAFVPPEPPQVLKGAGNVRPGSGRPRCPRAQGKRRRHGRAGCAKKQAGRHQKAHRRHHRGGAR